MASNLKQLACAIYTRKSSEEGLEQEFNSLDAQREACEAFVLSQRHEGWKVVPTHYDDGGFSGGNMERPALAQLLKDISDRRVDVVVVYKVDRLTRSLADFAKIVEVFDAHGVSFVSVTQQFNTTSSMGRLTLNVLLSFAQFEREVTGERIRDKIAASKRKGMWMGGSIPLGYDLKERVLVPNEAEASNVRTIFDLYLKHGSVQQLLIETKRLGLVTKVRIGPTGRRSGGGEFSRGHLFYILKNRIYLGEVTHKGQIYQGEHAGIVDPTIWNQVQSALAGKAPNLSPAKMPAHPSLLAGLVFDDRGNHLTPSHTKRRGARYRYYACRALLLNQPEKVGTLKRVPAHELEELITEQVHLLLKQPALLIDSLLGSDATADEKHSLAVGATKLFARFDEQASRDRGVFFSSIIRKIIAGGDQVEIVFNEDGLRNQLNLPQAEGKRDHERGFSRYTPVRLTRSGRRNRFIIGSSENQPRTNINGGMVKLIAKAMKWDQKVRGGASMQRIANDEKLGRSYVAHAIPLAFLAPDIIEAVLDGRQPPELKIKALFKPLPLEWSEQRRLLGFPAKP